MEQNNFNPKAKSRSKMTIINSASGILSKFVILAANFAIRTIFIYYLGIEYTGVSAVFSNILTILSFAELGIGSAITFALYKPIEQNDYRQLAKLMAFYRKAYFIIGSTVFAVGICLTPFLKFLINNVPDVKENITVIYLLYIFNTAFSYFFVYKSTLFTADQKNYCISIVRVCCVIAKTIVQCIVIALFRAFYIYLIIDIAFTVIQNIIISIWADKSFANISLYKNESLSKKEKSTLFKNIKALSMYKISATVLSGTDNIIMSVMLGVSTVGYVSNYTLIINELYSILLQFFQSLTASIGNLVASAKKDSQYPLFKTIYFGGSWLFCLCTVLLYTLIDEFVGSVWLGEKYLIEPLAVIFLCLDFYVKCIVTIVNSFREANGLFVQGQYRPIIMSILNIVISIISVKMIGLPGVFLGTIASRLLTQVWYDPYIVYKYAFKQSPVKFFFHYAVWLAILTVSIVLSLFINSKITISVPILSFIVHAIVSFAVTNIIVLACFIKTNTFRNTFDRVLSIIRK